MTQVVVEKKNMDLIMMGQLPFDRQDPINAGVLSYDYVGCSAGVAMFRIKYQCPVNGKRFNFVTSLSNISPGLIAYLYKLRWDIEKIFDEVKNKLSEKKHGRHRIRQRQCKPNLFVLRIT